MYETSRTSKTPNTWLMHGEDAHGGLSWRRPRLHISPKQGKISRKMRTCQLRKAMAPTASVMTKYYTCYSLWCLQPTINSLMKGLISYGLQRPINYIPEASFKSKMMLNYGRQPKALRALGQPQNFVLLLCMLVQEQLTWSLHVKWLSLSLSVPFEISCE